MVGNAGHRDVLVVAEEAGRSGKLHGQRLQSCGQLTLHGNVGVGIARGIGHRPSAFGLVRGCQVVCNSCGDGTLTVFCHRDGHLVDASLVADEAIGGLAAVRHVAHVGVSVLQLRTVIGAAGYADDARSVVVVAGSIECQLAPVAGIVHHFGGGEAQGISAYGQVADVIVVWSRWCPRARLLAGHRPVVNDYGLVTGRQLYVYLCTVVLVAGGKS